MMPYLPPFVKSLFLIILLAAGLAGQEGRVSLSLSANGSSETVVYRGWPLLIEVRALYEDGEAVPVQWPSPVRFAIRDEKAAVTWPLQLAATTEESVIVAAERSADGVWVLSTEATSALSVGDYTMRANHPVAGASRLLQLKVADEPVELSREQGSLKARLRSRYEELTGNREAALEMLNQWLAATPDDIAVLGQKAELLNDMDQIVDALNSAELALAAFKDQFKDAKHPPFGLMRRIRILQDKLTPP